MKRRASLVTLLAALGAAIALCACGRALPTAAQLAGNSSGASAAAALSPTTDPPTREVQPADRVGDLPRGPDARPDPGLRLPRGHRRHGALRLPAAPAARRLDHLRAGHRHLSHADQAGPQPPQRAALLGRSSGDRRRRRVVAAAGRLDDQRELLSHGLHPRQVDRRHLSDGRHHHAQAARLLADRGALADVGDRRREGLRREGGQEAGDAPGADDVQRPLQDQALGARPGADRGRQPGLLGLDDRRAGQADHLQGRRRHPQPDLGLSHRRHPGQLRPEHLDAEQAAGRPRT